MNDADTQMEFVLTIGEQRAPKLPSRLADRLSDARKRHFVGRHVERSLFAATLAAHELPFHVLHIYGPGGVGKTTLLREFATMCHNSQTPAILLDGRHIEPSPTAFASAIYAAMGKLSPGTDPHNPIFSPGRSVLLIDTYEQLAPLDSWLRETFLPSLLADTLVVLASRLPLAPVWRTDPSWQTFIRTILLHNLSPEESHMYLTTREISPDQHQEILAFTHGHPLALTLIADVVSQQPAASFRPESSPDIIRALLDHFIEHVPSPAHRAALEVCALVRLTTESLLAEVLSLPDAYELFAWLRDLSFIETGRLGLFPHDLARESLEVDIRWRNPEKYTELHRRVRTYYTNRLQRLQSQEQQHIISDYIFLHRSNPMVQPFYAWQESGTLVTEVAQEADYPALLEIITQHEGPESARYAAHWFRHQPQGVLVFRDTSAEKQRHTTVAGLLVRVELNATSTQALEADPAIRAAWHHLQRTAPLRPGEVATVFRFWMARDTYQAISPVQTLIASTTVRYYLTMPRLAFTFFLCADPDFWAPLCAYSDMARIPEADFEIPGRRYGAFGHDWRALPPVPWLALLAERETATELSAQPPAPETPGVVFSQDEFAAAVRDALRNAVRPGGLRENPLLRSQLVTERAGADANESRRIAVLQTLLQETCAALQTTPREMKYYRALYHTYLQPAATQEQAAELLDLPLGTFRRHLKSGVTRVIELLWERYTDGI